MKTIVSFFTNLHIVIFARLKILLTGYNGLIGLALHRELLLQGHLIYCLGLSKPLLAAEKLYTTDLSTNWNINIIDESVDVVIHLAQSPHFREFPEKAEHIFNVNSLSTLKLCDYGVKVKIKQLVYTSSAGIYGFNEAKMMESDEIFYNANLGFYLGSKHIAESIVLNYNNFFNTVVLRPFFVYGQRQKRDMLVPRLIENIKNRNEISLKGENGIWLNPTHVDDAATAIANSLRLDKSEIVNIAGPEILSLRSICDIIGKQVGIEPVFKVQESDEDEKLIGGIEKMSKLLHVPTITFSQGVLDFFEK